MYYFVSLVAKDFLFRQTKNHVLIVIKSVLVVSIVETTSHVCNAIQLTTLLKLEVNVNALQTMHPVRRNVYPALHYLVVQLVQIFTHVPNVSMEQALIYKMVNASVTVEVHSMADRAYHARKLRDA